jgi:hypothetical protein
MANPISLPFSYFVLSPEEASRTHGISVFGKRLSRKSNNVVVFPFAFHIAVQQPFYPCYGGEKKNSFFRKLTRAIKIEINLT